MQDYVSRIRVHSILIEFLETSDCTDEKEGRIMSTIEDEEAFYQN